MDGWNEWDFALLGVSAYVSIVMLVQLMRQRRDGLIDDLAQQASREQQKRQAANRQRSAERKPGRRGNVA